MIEALTAAEATQCGAAYYSGDYPGWHPKESLPVRGLRNGRGRQESQMVLYL